MTASQAGPPSEPSADEPLDAAGNSVLMDLQDGVLHLRLNRPATFNAMTLDMRTRLRNGGDRAHMPDVRCVLITAVGRGFCSGVDLEEGGYEGWAPRSDLRESFIPMMNSLAASRKPIVTAVQGVAAGAGLSLALCGDVVLAAPEASFIPVFTSLGIVPDAGLSHFLVRRMTYSKAFQWLLENERLSAEMAASAGLVNRVLPSEGFLESAHAYASRIAALPGVGASSTKQVMVDALRTTLVEQLEVEAQIQLWATKDEEGAAFRHAQFDRLLGVSK